MKRVLILGLGQYAKGSGISAALFYARQGAEVRVTDQKKEKDIAANVQRLKKFKNVSFVLGQHRLKDVQWADVIVRNPRVRPNSPEMLLATKLGKRMESDITLFLKRCKCPIVGVTGTRGKSTTTTLIAEMLKRSGKRVWIGGNILVSPLTFVEKIKPKDIVVLELSSWQLESTGAVGISPHVSVVTNLMRDHLNTYDGMEDYAEAKAQIFRHQKPDDIAVLNADDENGRCWKNEAPGRVLSFSAKSKSSDGFLTKKTLDWIDPINGKRETLLHRKDIKLLGEHSAMNILAACLAARVAGATISAIRSVAKNFSGIPDRLELIREVRGIKFINDTTATTPDATIAAILSISPISKTIRLIAGGADKELLFDELADVLKKKKVTVTLFEGTAFLPLSDALKEHEVNFQVVSSMKEALYYHVKNAKAGDSVLLSPGCASFGLFKNEFDRGAQFKKLVKRLK
jgi:UDP-N-acetylmuramoylalanine--D-glutamate ligase